jgi:hypothetical protein
MSTCITLDIRDLVYNRGMPKADNSPVQLDAATRARVERIWTAMNEQAAAEVPPGAPVSKTAVYRLVIAWGCAEYERAYSLRPPPGAGQFQSSAARPPDINVGRPRKVGQIPKSRLK